MSNKPCWHFMESTRNRLHRVMRLSLQAVGLATVLAMAASIAKGGVEAPETRPVLPGSGMTPPSVARQFDLRIDFASILQIADDVSAIVVGNPDIADASVVGAGILAMTGKAVGTTNIVVLGSNGGVLAELLLHVGADKPGAVTVRRAMQSSNYACTASSCWRSDGGADAVAAP